VAYPKRERAAMKPDMALQRLMAICSRKETSEWEVLKKLSRWKVDPEKHQTILKDLTKQGFVNNQRFAIAFARDKARFNKWGPRKIEQALSIQKIDPTVIKEVLQKVEEVQGAEVLLDLLKRKASSVKWENKNDLKVKLIRFGVSRGFDYSSVIAAASSIVKTADNNFDEP
jgi:regulatory protein